MDAHYDAQIRGGQNAAAFSGPARQFGSGAGLGFAALRFGRMMLPLIQKFVIPTAKKVAKSLAKTVVTAGLPEVMDVFEGKQNVRKAIRNTSKKTARATIKKASTRMLGGGGVSKRKRRRRRPPVVASKRRANKKRTKRTGVKRKRTTKRKPTKRSRLDILSDVRFNKK